MISPGRIAAAALIIVSATAGAAFAKPAPRQDWTRIVSVTPAGGMRLGNPKAKTALVEYGSLSCPHCRHFAETGVKPLVQQYVRTGKVSYEFRPYVLNSADMAATLIARCGGPGRYFPIADQLYATQPIWFSKATNLPKSEQDKIDALPQGQMMVVVAKVTGLFAVGAAHGIAPAQSEQCLRDEKAADALIKIEQTANRLGVQGTPTFFVNGKLVGAYDWPTLEPLLKEAGG